MVYDITKRSSFEHLQTWLEEVHRQGQKNMTIVMVGNKSDLGEKRTVSREEAEKFAKENGLSYVETSAKTAENVDYVFTKSAESIYENVKAGLISVEQEEDVADLDSNNSQEKKGCCN